MAKAATGPAGHTASWIPFAQKFLASDRPAREAITLLEPNLRSADVVRLDPVTIGRRISDIGKRIASGGNFAFRNAHYIPEVSLELKESLELWDRALLQPTTAGFSELATRAAAQAEAGYGFLRQWGPRLGALRWCCCMCWIGERARVINSASMGSSLGTVHPHQSNAALRRAKERIFHWIKELIHEAPVLKVFDFDLVGCGVYINGSNEPLPRDGTSEWFRRQMEMDIANLCRQARDLPPEELNATAPVLDILRPYGEPMLLLPPPEALRRIAERNKWRCELLRSTLDGLPSKALVEGPVLHCEKPDPPPVDLDDQEVVAKIQRGEALGKGDQEDGLPGAPHGSVGLIFAGLVAAENIDNIRICPGLLEVPQFMEVFLRYSTPILSLDFSGCDGLVDEACMALLPLAGPSLKMLDLESCGLETGSVEPLAQALTQLPGLQHLDLAHNLFNATAAARLVQLLFTTNRVDLATLRLDGNPVGDREQFRMDVANHLCVRGSHVVGGGELIFHTNRDAVRWMAEPRQGSFAARRRDDYEPLNSVSLEELQEGVWVKERELDVLEAEDPRARTERGQEIFRKQRMINAQTLGALGTWASLDERSQEQRRAGADDATATEGGLSLADTGTVGPFTTPSASGTATTVAMATPAAAVR